MNKKILVSIVLTIIILIGLVSAIQTCQVFDDFSSDILDTSKWEEGYARSGGGDWIDEHYLDTTNQNYHTSQLSQADKGVELKSLHIFQAGDILEFDLIYDSGSGNHWGCIFWDETSNWNDGLICVGHWNEVSSHGGEYGTYHIKGTYKEAGIDMEMILPNGSTETWDYRSSIYAEIRAPYTFSIITRTGHNGLAHMDYDNFEICSEEPDPALEERVEAFEQRTENLEEKIEILEKLISKINFYFNFMPYFIKKRILCGSIKETQIEDLGLNCELKQLRNKEKCVCKKI